ncbi:hypothetical protein GUITHDRAFT_103078 [Guillardia theta CCMP2712]|uniref:EF-hand domain-containing protein n=2 Tax=Guillardia theta TaxID=55529 RepID=L1JSU6_GUITC|nr:hypothetical protein GUITHDRAFT_103078 [Guillardia theta CCMP2712]EKX51158.1 hypothetical protein GUITHDRAFT_103078 [Guillardia theta CCMP2712]|eukprot:XP_005838138.1 hypothetical protein GUITHDRAFT_103078 [Guillardia theta CCMP2712]
MNNMNKDYLILFQLDNSFFIKAPARAHRHRPAPFDSDNIYNGLNSWVASLPVNRIDYSKFAKVSYMSTKGSPLLTRNNLDESDPNSWHSSPYPIIPKQSREEEWEVRVKLESSDSDNMPWLILEGQKIELPTNASNITKHFMGGRISIRLQKSSWGGPFVQMMSKNAASQYQRVFKQYDSQGNGTIDAADIGHALKQLGLSLEMEEVFELINRYVDASGEMSFNQFCEMIEAENHSRSAWFISAICVILPEQDFTYETILYRAEMMEEEVEVMVSQVYDDLELESNPFTSHQLEAALGFLGIVQNIDDMDKAMSKVPKDRMMSKEDFTKIIRSLRRKSVPSESTSSQNLMSSKRGVDAKLYRLKGNKLSIRSFPLPVSHKSLNAGDIFLLDSWNTLFLWKGEDAYKHEWNACKTYIKKLYVDRMETNVVKCKLTILEQHQESEEFWSLMGGKGPVAPVSDVVADEICKVVHEPAEPIPDREDYSPRCAVIGAGMAGAICAKTIREQYRIEVVVFDSDLRAGGRLGALERNGITYSSGAPYFCFNGPYMRQMFAGLAEEAIIAEWNPRVGILSKASETDGNSMGFAATLNLIEGERNIESILIHRHLTTDSNASKQSSSNMRSVTLDPHSHLQASDLPLPHLPHRKSHCHSSGRGHGASPWLISKPDMSAIARKFLAKVDTRLGLRVQAVLPMAGTGKYEVLTENIEQQVRSQGLFDFVLFCVPPKDADQLLSDCQPKLASIPRLIKFKPVWVVLVTFSHPVYSPYDAYFVEEGAFPPLQSAYRESSKFTSYDPMNSVTDWLRAEKPEAVQGPIWGGSPRTEHHRNAPSVGPQGTPVDTWTLHLTATWSEENRGELAPVVCQLAIKKFLHALGMVNSQIHVLMSQAILWEEGNIDQPASAYWISEHSDPSFGPFCAFDPATGIGIAGDWFVETSVEGALVSGYELAGHVGRSPIMYNEGHANPHGRVQHEVARSFAHRQRDADVISTYSSDSRPASAIGSDWEGMTWDEYVELQDIKAHHEKRDVAPLELIRKSSQCQHDGCRKWLPASDVEQHQLTCPFRACRSCPFEGCDLWFDVQHIEEHKMSCSFGVYAECDWCYKKLPRIELKAHRNSCLAKPTGKGKMVKHIQAIQKIRGGR